MKPNITVIICEHLVGEEHTVHHRMAVGVIIMILGVGISKAFFFIDNSVVHFIADGAGYLIHGIGGLPFVEYLTNLSGEKSKAIKENKDL